MNSLNDIYKDLARDSTCYPIFFPDGKVDFKVIVNKTRSSRVAKNISTKYIKNLSIWQMGKCEDLFDIVILDNGIQLTHKQTDIMVMIEMLPHVIKKTYIYPDGTKVRKVSHVFSCLRNQ